MPDNVRLDLVTRLCVIRLLLLCPDLFTVASGQQYDLAYKIREEQQVGTYVGNVARDSLIYNQFSQTEFQKLQYSIPPTSSQVSIDSKTSTIKSAQVIDREKVCDRFLPGEPCAINFDVSVYRVSSDGIFNLLRIIKVKLLIEDINDNAPAFPLNKTTLDVPENIEVNQLLRISGAIDMDTGFNNTVQNYYLKGGLDVFELEVIPNPGGLSSDLGIVVRQKLDRESTSYYQLKLIAEDGGVPKLTGSVDIFVRVIDVNDNAPQFRKASFDTVISEDTRVGSTVLTILADDPDEGDNGRLIYYFNSLTSSKIIEYLAIRETTGDIYLIKRLDYERDRSFRFAVIVSDNGTPVKSSQVSIQLIIEDVNDNAPKIDLTLPSAYVKESIGDGSYVAHISLSDIDSSENSHITCNIANEHFMLQKFPSSDSIYTVVLRGHLDYEKSRTELVNVTCHDGGLPPMYNSTTFTIYVQDVNDNAPVFTRSRYQVHIDEDNKIGQTVTQVEAVDPDEGENGNVTYSLSRNKDKKFEINPVTGIIKAMHVLDREEKSLYELEVVAKDQGNIPISSSVTVTIIIGDLNDNPPQFYKPFFEMSVQENKPKHTSCDSVIAIDPDILLDNHLRFQFVANFTYSKIFGIDRISGNIYTLVSLDREHQDTYSFDVMVFDESEPGFYDVATVTVTVLDDNDNTPNITFPPEFNNTFQFMFTQPPGSFLLGLEYEDLDEGENGIVRYAIIRGNDKGLFFVNSLSGELVVAKRMNIYDAGNYRLVILARDGGHSYLEAMREINLIITVANGTASYLQNEESRANIAIVIALICITAVLAISVLVTICIIRRIDRERRHHHNTKHEEENIYKQQVVTDTSMASPIRGNYETEIDKLKRQIRRDMSFAEDDDQNVTESSDMTNKSSFVTFRTTTSGSDQKNLSSTLSPSDVSKKMQYADKGLEIDRLTTTSSQSRIQPASSSSNYQSGVGSHWAGGRTQSTRGSLITFPVEDAASHSSGSTSDSGRGGSSEEGDGHGHANTVVVAIGDGDRARSTTTTYTTPAHLITFGSPKSTASSSSLQPRSLSTSLNSETARKRLWEETTSTSGTTVSTLLSSDNPLHVLGISETSDSYRPNISFSDDSVTANATVRNTLDTAKEDCHNSAISRTNISAENPHGQLHTRGTFAGSNNVSPKPTTNFTSTQRQKTSPTLSDTSLTANISRIPNADSSARHGMFVEGVNLSDPTGSSRSRSYSQAHKKSGNDKSSRNNCFNSSAGNRFINNTPQLSNKKSQSAGSSYLKSSRKPENETQCTVAGDAYSFNDMGDVLDQTSVADTHQDDDNTTTTSGSYTINADDLCLEIDQLFFNDIVV